MNIKKLLALLLVLTLVVCALPFVYAHSVEDAGTDDTDCEVDINDLKQPVAVKYGDANGDGEITPNDATQVLKFLAGWDVTVVKAAADANNDGEITPNDATQILKFLAGWDVTLG